MRTSEQQQKADAELHFDEHETTRKSVLEPHRVVIGKMRAAQWPYRKIAHWLKEQGRANVNAETVRSFCNVRGIRKGGAALPSDSKETDPRHQRIAERVARREKAQEADKPFTYDAFDQPIRTWRDEIDH